MSESYLVPGTDWHEVTHIKFAGQTFRPSEDFTLHYLDLCITPVHPYPSPIILLYEADDIHEPFGDYLSRNRAIVDVIDPGDTPKRTRFSMTPYYLVKDTEYVIIAQAPVILPPSAFAWRYQNANAAYTRGLRISSDNQGETWTKHYGDDHIFAVFGNPPSPISEPEPPIMNFATLGLGWHDTGTGFILKTWTSVPCHLYMVWTTTPPWKHTHSILRRGLLTKDALQYCFVNWENNEQIEEGDTLYHTFIKDPWPVCETRYFTFRSTIAGVWSSSVGPIFKKHHPGLPHKAIIVEPWTWLEILPPPCEFQFLEPWTWLEVLPPTFQQLIYEPWGPSPPPPPLAFYEPWGATLTENNPWEHNIPMGGVDWELYNSLIRLYNVSMDGCGIKVDFTPGDFPLLAPGGESLNFSASSVAPEPLTHDAYIPIFLYTTNGVDNYLIEMIISRGDFWGPWGSQLWGGQGTCGKDYGLYPTLENIKDFWVWARETAGLPADPDGWYIKTIALIFEAVEYQPDCYVINDWITLYYL